MLDFATNAPASFARGQGTSGGGVAVDTPLALESRWRPPMRFDSAARVCEKQNSRFDSGPPQSLDGTRAARNKTADSYPALRRG